MEHVVALYHCYWTSRLGKSPRRRIVVFARENSSIRTTNHRLETRHETLCSADCSFSRTTTRLLRWSSRAARSTTRESCTGRHHSRYSTRRPADIDATRTPCWHWTARTRPCETFGSGFARNCSLSARSDRGIDPARKPWELCSPRDRIEAKPVDSLVP